MKTRSAALWLAMGVLSSGAGCAQKHFSVGIARGPTHVTYAQRHQDIAKGDYLVDCEIDPGGAPKNCSVVPLPTR